jgi:predicted HicB family RNase H-like nuclease
MSTEISVDIEDEVYEQLIELAEEEGISIETLVEQIITDYFFDEKD